MNFKKNVALWVGLAIPVLMVIFVAISIYWPQQGVEPPQHHFVYALRNYSDGYEYTVQNGQLVRDDVRDENVPKPVPSGVANAPTRFFLHDVGSNISQEVKFEDVQQMKLDNTVGAPDGYEIKRGGEGGGVFPFFFSEGNYDDQYLVKGNKAIKLNLQKINDPYYAPFQFIGWIIN